MKGSSINPADFKAPEVGLSTVKSLPSGWGLTLAGKYQKSEKGSVLELDQKFDLFFDVVSNLSYGKCKHVLNAGGIYITLLPDFSFATGLVSSLFSSKKCKMCVVKSKKETLEQLSELIDAGKIKTPIASHFEMEKLAEAMDFFDKGSVQGKIAIGR